MNADDLARGLARLNHILIPGTKAGRDRARRNPLVRLANPLVWLYKALNDDGRWLALVSILVGFAALDVATSQTWVLWCILTGALVAGLLMRPAYRLDAVRLEIDAPRQVTVGETVRFRLALVNDGARDFGAVSVDRPLLPWDGTWSDAPPVADAVPGRQSTYIHTHARFSARGHHHLDAFHAAALVPFGISQGQRIDSEGAHLLVVPEIAEVTRIRLPERSRYQHGGVALASNTGESMELLGVRPYRHGDPVRDLHARSWAKRGQPVVREFQQEYFSRVGVVLDTDLRGAGPETLEAAISLAAGVIACLTRGEALIDLLVTGDRLHALTLGRSLGYLEQALDHLACVSPGPGFDPGHLQGLLGPYLERLSCVVFISLAWDRARAGMASSIRVQGTACRTLVVCRDAASMPAGDADLSVLTCEQVTAGGGLAL